MTRWRPLFPYWRGALWIGRNQDGKQNQVKSAKKSFEAQLDSAWRGIVAPLLLSAYLFSARPLFIPTSFSKTLCFCRVFCCSCSWTNVDFWLNQKFPLFDSSLDTIFYWLVCLTYKLLYCFIVENSEGCIWSLKQFQCVFIFKETGRKLLLIFVDK